MTLNVDIAWLYETLVNLPWWSMKSLKRTPLKNVPESCFVGVA